MSPTIIRCETLANKLFTVTTVKREAYYQEYTVIRKGTVLDVEKVYSSESNAIQEFDRVMKSLKLND